MAKTYGKYDAFWAIFVTHYYSSCGTTYRHLTTKKSEWYENYRGDHKLRFVDAPLHVYKDDFVHDPQWLSQALKFETAEEALAMVKTLQDQGVLPKTDMYGLIPVKVGETAPYDSTRPMISILQRPLESIEGKYRAWALDFWKEHPDFHYDNEHRYQVARMTDFKWHYLKSVSPYEWTRDRTEALCLTSKECHDLCETLNEIGKKETPYKGHVQPQNLPAHHENEPLFRRGDIVKYGSSDEERTIYDIISFGKGWVYEVECDHKWGSCLHADENFFKDTPFSELHAEEELTLIRKGA